MASILIGYINTPVGTHSQVHGIKTNTTTSLHMTHDSYTAEAAQEFTALFALVTQLTLTLHSTAPTRTPRLLFDQSSCSLPVITQIARAIK